MKRDWLRIVAMALILLFTAGSSVIAGKGHKGYGGHAMRSGHRGLKGFLGLKLTEAQQAELTKIIDKYHEEKHTMKSRLWEAKEKLNDAIYGETYDEPGIRKAAQDVSSIKEELSVLRAKMYQELKTVLSTEQLELLGAMKSHKYGHGGCR